MSDKKSSKKRKQEAVQAVRAGGDDVAKPVKFHPGPTFKEVDGHALIDLSGVKDGSKELWLLQLPKPLSYQGLHGVTLDIDTTGSAATQALGTLSSKEGTKFSVKEESAQLSQQLFVVSCGTDGSTPETLGMLPLSRRVTLDRIEEGPLPLPVAQQQEVFPEDHTQPVASEGAAQDKHLEQPSASKKDKKKSKDKDRKKDKDKKRKSTDA